MIPLQLMRWTARLWAGACLAFVGYFVLAHVFAEEAVGAVDIDDVFVLTLFPGAYLLGLALAFRWECLGGGLATLALFILFASHSNLLDSMAFPLLLTPPAVLFLLSGLLSRHKG